MKRFLLLQFCIVFAFTISGITQEWDYTSNYAPSNGYQVIQTIDSNFLVAEKGSWPGSTIKLNRYGEILWTVQHGGYSIQETFDGGYIIAGYVGGSDASLLKLTSNGNMEWNATFENTQPNSFEEIIQDSDSNFVVCGSINDANGYNQDFYILKTNRLGELLWEKSIGGGSGFCADLIEVNNFYYIVGYNVIESGINNFTFYLKLFKLNFDGTIEWTKTHSTDYASGFSIDLTNDSSLITTGAQRLIKFDLNGIKLWDRTSYMYSHDVKSTVDNGYILAGNKSGDNCLIKVNSEGDSIWEQHYTNEYNSIHNRFKSVICTFDQGYIACGWSKSDSTRLRIVKTDGGGYITGYFDVVQPNEIKIYPNPTTDKINIESESKNLIKVFSSNGRLILSQLNSDNSISLGDNPPGIYIMKIETKNGTVAKKIIKQ